MEKFPIKCHLILFFGIGDLYYNRVMISDKLDVLNDAIDKFSSKFPSHNIHNKMFDMDLLDENSYLLTFIIYDDENTELNTHIYRVDINDIEDYDEVFDVVNKSLSQSDGFIEISKFIGGIYSVKDILSDKVKVVSTDKVLGAKHTITGKILNQELEITRNY